MNYRETIGYLFSQLPMFQRIGKAAYRDNLDNILALDEAMGHPHRHFKTIHVAGTNGKGSVSHMLAAILSQAGCKTGLHTSPHFRDYRERIRINGRMIEKDFVVAFVREYRLLFDSIKPSFFEMAVAMTFKYFEYQKVDIAVVETGLGGRLDSTNIITPVLSVITNIGYDHMQFLGDTLEKIAAEKAGIIKANVPVVVGQTQAGTIPVFERVAAEKQAPLIIADRKYRVADSFHTPDRNQLFRVEAPDGKIMDIVSDLAGLYQKKNVITVLASVDVLRDAGFSIADNDVVRALGKVGPLTGLAGRWQVLGHEPLVVADMAHNRDGLSEVMEQVRQTPHKRLHIVFGMVSDKDDSLVLPLLPSDAIYYFTRADLPRAMDENVLMERATKSGLKGMAYHRVSDALKAARKNAAPGDMVLVTGSAFVVAEII